MALVFLGMYLLQWFIFNQIWLVINAVLFVFITALTFYFGFLKTSDSFIGKLGESGIVGFLFFCSIGGLATGFTFLFGTAHKYEGNVLAYGWFSNTCGYKLKLSEFTPTFGSFCCVGNNESDYKENDKVVMSAKESMFGTLITEIKPLQ